MKVTKRSDGTYTLSEVTREDLNLMTLALSDAGCTWRLFAAGKDRRFMVIGADDMREWHGRTGSLAERLSDALGPALSGYWSTAGSRYLPNGRSYLIQSRTVGDDQDGTYTITDGRAIKDTAPAERD